MSNDIKHPDHYTFRGIECGDLIDSLGFDYNEGNVFKYLYRYKKKGGLKDLDKAIEYLERLKRFYVPETPIRLDSSRAIFDEEPYLPEPWFDGSMPEPTD